jgi:ribokinase
LPVPGEEVAVKQVTRVSGGTGGNVAVAAARILGAGKVALIGAVGHDGIGCQQITALEAEGVVTGGIDRIAEEESGQAYILVDQAGQNVIASHLGANARLGPEDVHRAWIDQQLKECRSIVLTDPPLEMAEELIALAKESDAAVLWDPGVLISQNRGALLALAKEVEVLFLNETEASTLLGTEQLDTSLQRLQELGFCNQIVLKLGARGVVMFELAKALRVEVPALPLRELGLEVINTVGCGDAFVGAFAAYHTLGADFRNSLVMATAAGCVNATRSETWGSPERPILEETEQKCRGLGFTVREHRDSESAK